MILNSNAESLIENVTDYFRVSQLVGLFKSSFLM